MENTDKIFNSDYINSDQTSLSYNKERYGNDDKGTFEFSKSIDLSYKSDKPKRVVIKAKIAQS